jgi:hypothetical protein
MMSASRNQALLYYWLVSTLPLFFTANFVVVQAVLINNPKTRSNKAKFLSLCFRNRETRTA